MAAPVRCPLNGIVLVPPPPCVPSPEGLARAVDCGHGVQHRRDWGASEGRRGCECMRRRAAGASASVFFVCGVCVFCI